jgi:iron complex transport system permease protein
MESGGSAWLVFSQVRLPRCVLALLVGASLALSGAVYQGLFRNPLVSPNILGVSAGCTLGAALGLILPGLGFGMVRGLAFILGLGAVFAALALARLVAVRSVIVLVLAGLVITSVLNAVLMIIKTLADPYSQLPAIVFWIMGSLHRSSWQDLYWALPIMGGGYVFCHALRFRLNVLSLGDDQARSLGTNPRLWRLAFIGVSSLMVAFAVSTCGQIAWLGLVAPHMARTLVGPNHERMIPVTALLGALFLLVADALARTLTAAELPVSIITSLTGGPFFAYLLYRNRGSGWT